MEALEKDATIKGKSRSGTEFSYKGITAEQIITKAKAVLIGNGILYTSDVLEQRSVSGNKTAVYMRGYFENVDDPTDVIERHAWGEGTDDADKGTAKATTNANKILLSRTLNMSTTEYEGVDIVNHEPEAKPTAVKDAEALTEVTLKTWADGYKRNLDGCQDLKQLAKVRAENSHMMKHPGVPEVTKNFFIERIAALEGILSNPPSAKPQMGGTPAGNLIAPNVDIEQGMPS